MEDDYTDVDIIMHCELSTSGDKGICIIKGYSENGEFKMKIEADKNGLKLPAAYVGSAGNLKNVNKAISRANQLIKENANKLKGLFVDNGGD